MKLQTRVFATREGGQTDFWNDWKSRLLFLEGGWGSGKTWIGARKLLAGTLYNAIDVVNGRPTKTGIESAMVGPGYRSMADFMMPAFEGACTDWGVRYRWHSKDSLYVLPQFGCRVRCRTAERPDMITGWEVACAWGDEPARWKEDRTNPKDDPYLQLLGRVRGKGKLHQVYFTYTNEGDHTRIFEEAHSALPGRARFRARTKDNPTVSDFYEYQKATLTPALADQYLEGGAARLGGMLAYAAQLSAKHFDAVATRLVPGLPLQLTLDFNINPGMHGYVGQYLEAHDVFIVAHEFHGPRMTVRELVQAFGLWVGGQGGFKWPHLEIFGDATGKSEWAGTGESQYDVLAQGLRELGLKTSDGKPVEIIYRVGKSNPEKVDRVNALNVALCDMSGQRHMLIAPQCERLADDLRRCKWDGKGKGMETNNPALTHPTDAIGYWVYYLRPVRRWVEGVGGRVSV